MKYVYDCEKPTLASVVIIAGRVNASERKTTPGSTLRTSAISHSQKGTGFVCGLSTRKHAHAVADPEQDDLEQRLPEPAPVLGLEVDVVDVLVLLGRVLGVLQRPVGPAVEPLGMLLQPRVVGRALDREVERDLDADLAAARHEPLEVVERAEVGMDRGVAALLAADRPRAADVVLLRGERVVAALAVRDADRMDRRQVDDVEAELRELRQHLLDALQAAERAREELVPRAEAGQLALDVHPELQVELDLAVPVLPRQGEGVLERQALAEQRLPLGELPHEVGLAACELAPHLVLPGRDPVAPRGDRERPPARSVDGERAAPLVVPERLERRLAPAALARRAVADRGAEHVVPVAEDRRRDDDLVADVRFTG